MSMVEGGLRDRLVFESFALHVKTGLEALGWVGVTTGPRKPQFGFRTTPVPDVEEIPANTIAVTFETVDMSDGEIGSNLTENSHAAWVDIYTDTTDPNGYALAMQISGDVRDLLRGKMRSIGFEEPVFQLVDNRDPDDPVVFGWCDLEDIVQERSASETRSKRWWVAVAATVVEARE